MTEMTRDELFDALRATLTRVSELAQGLSRSQLTRRPKDGEWSMAEIVNHLLVGERTVILPRLKQMLLEEAPVFESSASSQTGFATDPEAVDFEAGLAAFRSVREETLAFLKAVKNADWQRTGTSPTRGTLTLEAYARYLAEHDREHLVQLETTRGVVAR